MLSLSKSLIYFKYDLKEILQESDMDEAHITQFMASIITKASRVSLDDAKEYIHQVATDGKITEETAEKICKLPVSRVAIGDASDRYEDERQLERAPSVLRTA